MSRSTRLFNCLIRTHHVTSRKKLQKVRRAAKQHNVDWVLVRSGGSPGIFYGESRDESGLEEWVSVMQALRYKDYQCVAKPGLSSEREEHGAGTEAPRGEELPAMGFHETETTADFAQQMDLRNLLPWWKKGMGYEK